MLHRKTIAVLIMAIIVIGAVFSFFQQSNAAPVLPSQKWPAFTMVYQEWRYGLGINGNPGTQRIKLTYTDALHWRTEILSHSAIPAVAGAWDEYDGATVTSFDPRTGQKTVNNVALDQGIHISAEWLRPDYVSFLMNKPLVTQLAERAVGEKGLEYIEHLPCTDPSGIEKQAGLASCASNQREAKRTIRYRQQDNIPLEITDTLDGVVVQRITIESLVTQSN